MAYPKITGRGTYGQLKGPPEPINERLRLKLAVSEELKKRRGIGTTMDRVEKSMETNAQTA